jgi:hypothetical protein
MGAAALAQAVTAGVQEAALAQAVVVGVQAVARAQAVVVQAVVRGLAQEVAAQAHPVSGLIRLAHSQCPHHRSMWCS